MDVDDDKVRIFLAAMQRRSDNARQNEVTVPLSSGELDLLIRMSRDWLEATRNMHTLAKMVRQI